MPLSLSAHSHRLPVQHGGCCRECSALFSCRNQAIVVLRNSCHVHHQKQDKNRGGPPTSPFSSLPRTTALFQGFWHTWCTSGEGPPLLQGHVVGPWSGGICEPQPPASPHGPQHPPYPPQQRCGQMLLPDCQRAAGASQQIWPLTPKPLQGSILWRGPWTQVGVCMGCVQTDTGNTPPHPKPL